MPRRSSRGGVSDWTKQFSKSEQNLAHILYREIFETGDYFVHTCISPSPSASSICDNNEDNNYGISKKAGDKCKNFVDDKSCENGQQQHLVDEDEGFEDDRTASKPYLKMLNLNVQEYLQELDQLLTQIEDRVEVISSEISNLEGVDRKAAEISDKLNKLGRQVTLISVWHGDHTETEQQLGELREQLEAACTAARELHTTTRKQMTDLGQMLPPSCQTLLSNTELTAEKLLQQLEELESEHKRAKTVRYEFQVDVEEVQFWISKAEGKIQDGELSPYQLKDNLSYIQSEVTGISDQLDNLLANGKTIGEKTDSQQERELVHSTTTNLTEQLTALKQLIDDKKSAANDAIDAWQKFVALHAAVKAWCEERDEFLKQPLTFTSLNSAKLRVQDYATAIKSIKNVNKSLSEMGVQLKKITAVGSAGDLFEDKSEVEKYKGEIEGNLVERNALLQELSEEWEQCERKLKETQAWTSKSRDSLESLQNKKRPIKDQLNLREKMNNDITIQRKRAVMALEKLQVHFTDEMEGDKDVFVLGRQIDTDLDSLDTEVREQAKVLEACIDQLDRYQQEIGSLRGKILSCEGELRAVSSPAYTARDRDKALAQQSACRERIRGLQSKITAFTQRINLINQRGTPDTDDITASAD